MDLATVVCKKVHKISFLVHKWQFFGGQECHSHSHSLFQNRKEDNWGLHSNWFFVMYQSLEFTYSCCLADKLLFSLLYLSWKMSLSHLINVRSASPSHNSHSPLFAKICKKNAPGISLQNQSFTLLFGLKNEQELQKFST